MIDFFSNSTSLRRAFSGLFTAAFLIGSSSACMAAGACCESASSEEFTVDSHHGADERPHSNCDGHDSIDEKTGPSDTCDIVAEDCCCATVGQDVTHFSRGNERTIKPTNQISDSWAQKILIDIQSWRQHSFSKHSIEPRPSIEHIYARNCSFLV